MNLRKYQSDAIDSITTEAASGKRRILLQMATGLGKTHVAAAVIKHCISNGGRVLVLTHRVEILSQTQKKLEDVGVEAGIMLSGEPYDPTLPVVVASIMTMHSWVVRRKRENRPRADLVIIDECHHLTGSVTWQKILELYPQAFILGLTATPISKTGKGLAAYFDCIVKGPSYADSISSGFLVPLRYYVPSVPDLKGIRVQAGDYAEGDLAERMDTPKLVGDIVENWVKFCSGRQTVVFTASVKHSIHVSESFNFIGVPAEHIDGETPSERRKEILAKFASGDIKVISNCAILTEGWDCPQAACLVLARPTKSLLLYLQTVGRVLRPSEGKKDCLVMDHSGIIYEHGPVDQDWEWKLEYLPADKERRAEMKQDKVKKSITCRNCKCVYWKRPDCPNCGTVPIVRGKPIATYEAYLLALDESEKERRLALVVDKRSWWAQLRRYGIDKNYSKGWAWHKYREKFGAAPSNAWYSDVTAYPGEEVRSWIRHTQIKWAKSKANQKPWKLSEKPVTQS